MSPEQIQAFIDQYPTLAPWALGAAAVAFSAVVFVIARFFIARGLTYLASRTENKYDDIVVAQLHPYRFAWIAPLLVIYYFAGLLPNAAEIIRHIVLFLILWLSVLTVNSLLNAVNLIYESSSLYRGEPIQGYLDLIKIVLVVAAIIITISLFTGQSVVVLLGGLGAVMAVLLLIFRDTLLSFVANIQIQSNDLIMEGDSIEAPSYGADGEVVNMALHTVTIQNWDRSFTMIPTYKLLETPYKNWRGMEQSGARRIKRALHIDVNSIKFCDADLIERLRKVPLIKERLDTTLDELESGNQVEEAAGADFWQGCNLTNIGVFQVYATNYLKGRSDLHQEGLRLLVRQLAPSPTGLPLEIYAFTKTIEWAEYESIQAEIFDHLLAALPQFDLRVFQEPTGLDFQKLGGYARMPADSGQPLLAGGV